MSGLRNLISSLGLQGTPSEIADALNAKTITMTINDRVTWATIANTLGAAETTRFDTALRTLGLEWVRTTLSGVGFDFSNPQTQAMLDQFHADGHLSDDEAEVLKGLGIRQISPYEQYAGEGQVVTADQVAEALKPVEVVGKTWSLILRYDQDQTSVVFTASDKLSDGSMSAPTHTILARDLSEAPEDFRESLQGFLQWVSTLME